MHNNPERRKALVCVERLQHGYNGDRKAGIEMAETIKNFINTTDEYIRSLELDYDGLYASNYGGTD